MLIQFSVKNYRSIKDEAELQLITDSGKELLDSNTFAPDANGAHNFRLMKSAVIYGANAAGKSNILNALSKMQWLVQFSATKLQADEALDIEPFKFSTDSIDQPTEFNMDFVSDGVRYQYGFSATNQRVLEEWLFAYPNGRAQTWFMREYDVETSGYRWTKDAYLTGSKAIWKEATRDNALFLSTAIQLNSKQLTPVYRWFTDTLRVVEFRGLNHVYSADQMHNLLKSQKETLAFLNAAGLAIDDIRVREEALNPASLPDNMPEELRTTLQSLGNITVEIGHRSDDGSLHYLDLREESDGTQRTLFFAAHFIDSIRDGAVLIIDGIDNGLHPTVVKYLVSLFNNTDKNTHNAQLVFTTHEASMLSQDVFRRDQVWFCEKTETQSTSLYPLSGFNVRKGAENIGRDYLSGKYGALPFIDENNKSGFNG